MRYPFKLAKPHPEDRDSKEPMPMKRVPPSEQIRQEISSSLSEGLKEDGNILAEMVSQSLPTPL